ncbi:hypothetical protein ACJJTC_011835 [Scirpophaga incertulas]
MYRNNKFDSRLKPSQLHYFSWLNSIAPCFPVHASKLRLLSSPSQFYDTLCEKFLNAKNRVSIASLYIGTGQLEQKMLTLIKQNMSSKKKLKLNVLLDYQRGTRGVLNSQTMFEVFLNEFPEQSNITLFQTPRLQGAWSKALPARYNELIGLQHMKLYIADDAVLLSGANCSNDYFQQRQDRYIVIEDLDLANFYCDLIDEVSKYSNKCVKGRILYSKAQERKNIVKELNVNVTKLIEKWKNIQQKKMTNNKNANCIEFAEADTWIFPLIQMGEFNITQDEQATHGILTSAPKGSYIRLATGYFNLTDKYANTLLKDCKANISLLMAHPNANGFLGAAGPAGGIPYAYSLLARKFWEQVEQHNQVSRVRMLEYERSGWTFHAKGLWYYPPGSGVPWATVIGSANLGERSVRRDLEAQAAIFTTSTDLQERLHEECTMLHQYSSDCSSELKRRGIPVWVKATVRLFRTYF